MTIELRKDRERLEKMLDERVAKEMQSLAGTLEILPAPNKVYRNPNLPSARRMAEESKS